MPVTDLMEASRRKWNLEKAGVAGGSMNPVKSGKMEVSQRETELGGGGCAGVGGW